MSSDSARSLTVDQNERGISPWELLRYVLSIVAVFAAGAASLSARLVVQRADEKDAELARRVALLESQIARGILPRTGDRIDELQRDVQRLEREVDRLREQNLPTQPGR